MSKLLAVAAHPIRRWVVLLVWLGLCVVAVGPPDLSGRFADAEENEASAFLPGDAESTRALTRSEELRGGDVAPALVVYHRRGGLTGADRERIARDRDELNALRAGRGATAEERERSLGGPAGEQTRSTVDVLATATTPFSSPQVSEDRSTALLSAQIRGDGQNDTIIAPAEAWRDRVSTAGEDTSGDALQVKVGGPAGAAADAVAVFASINGTLITAALTLVIVLLILIYRSPIFWLVPITAVIGAELVSRAGGYGLSELGATVNGQSTSIMSVLVIGAGTDYALLLVARYREELLERDDRLAALRTALVAAGPAILASGATVVVALLTLLLARVNATAGLGPMGAVGVTAAMISMLTLLPAILAVVGRRVFWPFVPRTPGHPASELRVSERGRRVATASRPMLVLVALGGGVLLPLLAGLAVGGAVGAGLGALGGAALGVPLGLLAGVVGLVLAVRALAAHVHNPVEARLSGRAQRTSATGRWRRLGERVARRPRRTWVATAVLLLVLCLGLLRLDVDLTQNDSYRSTVESQTAATLLARGFPAGSDAPTEVVVPDAERAPAVARAVAEAPGVATAAPAVGQGGEPVRGASGALVEAQLAENPYSQQAQGRIDGIRLAARQAGGEDVLVGGQTAIAFDQKDAAAADTLLIVPVALVVVLVVLVLLLRALVAPLVLIATVVLSFGAALGVSVLVWEYVFGFAGTDPSIPLYAFVFLVALGIDYNIFLMARVREEALGHGTREGTLRGLAATGGVITSAGLVLAGTFAVLGVLPLVFLTQIGFAVAFGVLLDTFIVRSVLVPALGLDLDRRLWWPSRLGRGRATTDRTPVEARAEA